MINKTIGFIGGGRIARIMLSGFTKAGISLNNFIVSDCNSEVLKRLKDEFPAVTVLENGNKEVIKSDIVFVAVHPPVMASTLEDLKMDVLPNTIIISLAPKFTISKISELLNGASKVVRMIPNAPSIIGRGFNPIAMSETISDSEKKVVMELFNALGESRVVSEKNLEAYAVLTAMGPTYLWFQLYELQEIVKDFGLSDEEASDGIKSMVLGALATMFDTGLASDKVMDLIPSKPLSDHEATIKAMYHDKLNMIYQKIKP